MLWVSQWNTVGILGKSVEHCGCRLQVSGTQWVLWVSQWNTVGVVGKSVEHCGCCW